MLTGYREYASILPVSISWFNWELISIIPLSCLGFSWIVSIIALELSIIVQSFWVNFIGLPLLSFRSSPLLSNLSVLTAIQIVWLLSLVPVLLYLHDTNTVAILLPFCFASLTALEISWYRFDLHFDIYFLQFHNQFLNKI